MAGQPTAGFLVFSPKSQMPERSTKARVETSARRRRNDNVGRLPEWNLADLYAGTDAPEVARDLAHVDGECRAFESEYRGRLAALGTAPDGGRALAAAVQRYEALEEVIGRLISYAGLVHAADTTDPVRAKFYGDVRDRITSASSHILFFVLELNRIDDSVLESAMADPALAHYRPWLEDIRKEKPYQLEDRVEQLPF
jgi:oligoendopeptidase F